MHRRIKNIFLNTLKYKDFSIIIQKIQNKYNSDKSYSGKNFAMKKVNKHLSLNVVLIMNHIQDNLFFKDFIKKNKLNFKVFGCKNQLVGFVENIGLQLKVNFKKKF
jgi:hypothetical protein|tara:strand:+ start:229 stop:546 length:318 start_codon:yes stop_codon:yes gene_type:complete